MSHITIKSISTHKERNRTIIRQTHIGINIARTVGTNIRKHNLIILVLCLFLRYRLAVERQKHLTRTITHCVTLADTRMFNHNPTDFVLFSHLIRSAFNLITGILFRPLSLVCVRAGPQFTVKLVHAKSKRGRIFLFSREIRSFTFLRKRFK